MSEISGGTAENGRSARGLADEVVIPTSLDGAAEQTDVGWSRVRAQKWATR